MKEAEVKSLIITIASNTGYEFEETFQQVLFPGFLTVLNPEFVKKNSSVPPLKLNENLKLQNIDVSENQTKPPPRFNEASLIKLLEEKGIGRPSTYAPIITLIQEKNYVDKENRYFVPTNLGTAISDYLAKVFLTFLI